MPSEDVKNRIEDQIIPEITWAARNQISPNFGGGVKPAKKLLPKWAKDWEWSVSKQEWQPTKNKEEHLGNNSLTGGINKEKKNGLQKKTLLQKK